ncbi:hypothetical protein PL321_10820 [Caloramator sp. mosi_1]|uniref:hypothetical protein n=1 Tax=Caloramator sp. mosi_1 TaxID=3023090 RepID=UPI0023605C2B|nr:hypothetical protein [Caloramator sp. mosi_1]WDC83271.1 hypothetical protein PL321_10820 [Caloramator sp. mosi_1]
MKKYKKQVIAKVEELVGSGQLLEADKICKELYSIFKYDVDVLNANAVVDFSLNNVERSLEFLTISYVLNDKDFETLYNIANVLEYKNRLKDCLYFYNLANNSCVNKDLKFIIEEKINTLNQKLSNASI